MVTIQVFYPEADGKPLSESDIAVLRRFESVITKRAVALFNSTSNYRWETDLKAEGPRRVRLVKDYDNREITSQTLAFLNRCSEAEFEDILVRRSWEMTREDEKRQRENAGEHQEPEENIPSFRFSKAVEELATTAKELATKSKKRIVTSSCVRRGHHHLEVLQVHPSVSRDYSKTRTRRAGLNHRKIRLLIASLISVAMCLGGRNEEKRYEPKLQLRIIREFHRYA